jgi:hypothetical protein
MTLRETLQRAREGAAAAPRWRMATLLAMALVVAVGVAGVTTTGARARPKHHATGAKAKAGLSVSLEKGTYSAALAGDGLGANTATWDDQLSDPKVPGLITQASIGLLRFPGGSAADEYDWKTNEWAGKAQPSSYATFMSLAAATAAAPFVTVNYGTGTPQEAAAWVTKAASMPDQSGALWEVGNEQYGAWETDRHASAHSPQSYASHAEEFIKAMLAANSHAKIGVPYALTPSQACGSGVEDASSWNSTVLGQDGGGVSLVDVHWYPFCGTPTLSDEQIVSSVQTIPAVMATIRSTLSHYDASAKVVIGETNISNEAIRYSEQPIAALFSAATSLAWLAQGTSNVTWWDLHGAPDGLISYGTGKDLPEPSYYGYELASHLATPGSRVAALSTGSATLVAFGGELAKGGRAVLLINARKSGAQTVSVSGLGSGKLQRFAYAGGKLATGQSTTAQAQKGIKLPAQSIEVLQNGE